MSIIYNKDRNVFVLNTGETTYGIAIVDGRYVAHGYYGKGFRWKMYAVF